MEQFLISRENIWEAPFLCNDANSLPQVPQMDKQIKTRTTEQVLTKLKTISLQSQMIPVTHSFPMEIVNEPNSLS